MKSDIQINNILAVDDDFYVLEAYKKIFEKSSAIQDERESELKDLRSELFGEKTQQIYDNQEFNLTTCNGGKEAVAKVKEAKAEGRPYSVAFVDVVMPPGPDGIWTSRQIRLIDKDVNIVIVTAHSDKSVDEIAAHVKPADKLFYLKKPFHTSEIRQFAIGLSAKWKAERDLTVLLSDRTADLVMTNIAFNEEMDNHIQTKEDLELSRSSLAQKSKELASFDIAMQSLYERRLNIKSELEESIVSNVKNLIEPNIEKLKQTRLDPIQERLINILEADLTTISSPFMKNQTLSHFRLTRNEVNVAKLIISGNSSREICELLNLSKRTVDYYREKMRQKLGIQNSKISLKNRLLELDSI